MKIEIHNDILKMNKDEISSIVATINMRRKQLHCEAGSQFKVGLTVKFGRTNGRKRTGTVEKINRTKAVVNVDGQRWRVPFTMMQAI